MISDSDEPIELLRLGDEKAPVVISLSKYKGMRFIDIRRYYFDKTSKTTKPTPKGISLKEEEFGLIADFLVSNMSALQDLFTADLNVNEMTFRGNTLEKKARKKVSTSRDPVSYEIKSWPAMEFFNVDASASTVVVNFNKKNKFISNIEQTSPEIFTHLKDIVIAYQNAKNSLQFSGKQNPSVVLENIELEWARNLNVQQ
jgi:hypothetical protein